MIYCFDIDGTICTLREDSDYLKAKPYEGMLIRINQLYDDGHMILFMTARGSVSKKDWTTETRQQLQKWGFKYHELICNKKPHADIFIDDKGINVTEWKKTFLKKRRGFIAGCFDLIHPGYIKMWKDAKTVCDYLIVGLQTDPTIDRPDKNKPIHSLEERYEMLSSIKYIDEIIIYETEEDLYKLLKEMRLDIRILGTDYKNRNDYTGNDLDIPVYFHERNHHWSATNLREKIKNQEKK
tara:strand:+ start:1396 stop:2112 length:717 start_codon:yes stop_codon:yes gene_type:complete